MVQNRSDLKTKILLRRGQKPSFLKKHLHSRHQQDNRSRVWWLAPNCLCCQYIGECWYCWDCRNDKQVLLLQFWPQASFRGRRWCTIWYRRLHRARPLQNIEYSFDYWCLALECLIISFVFIIRKPPFEIFNFLIIGPVFYDPILWDELTCSSAFSLFIEYVFLNFVVKIPSL